VHGKLLFHGGEQQAPGPRRGGMCPPRGRQSRTVTPMTFLRDLDRAGPDPGAPSPSGGARMEAKA
jgi:hypothetical protein